jgi:hypothetical protein
VASEGLVEVEFLRDVERLDPIVGIAVGHEGRSAVEGVAE